jgi:hypothetical protein
MFHHPKALDRSIEPIDFRAQLSKYGIKIHLRNILPPARQS